jgi:hypothetical protein
VDQDEHIVTHLSFDGIPTLFTEIHEIQYTTLQMRQRRDALHLDRIHLFQRVVKDPRRVDDLPSKVLVVQVPHKKRFCRERVRLDIDVRARDLVDKRRFTDVRIAAYEEGARVRVDRRQTRYVLSDLLEVR